jgi:hypothetical protein
MCRETLVYCQLRLRYCHRPQQWLDGTNKFQSTISSNHFLTIVILFAGPHIQLRSITLFTWLNNSLRLIWMILCRLFEIILWLEDIRGMQYKDVWDWMRLAILMSMAFFKICHVYSLYQSLRLEKKLSTGHGCWYALAKYQYSSM